MALLGALVNSVVVSRGHEGCRNIDLVASLTHPGRYLVVEKPSVLQQAHFDLVDTATSGESCRGFAGRVPVVDLLDGISRTA